MAKTNIEILTKILGGSDELASGLAKEFGLDSTPFVDSLLDAIDTVVFVTDPNGSMRYVNSAWERLTEFSLDETRKLPQTSYLHPQDRDVWLWLLESRKRASQKSAAPVLRFLTRSGETIHLEASAQAVVAENGRCVGFVGTLADVGRRVHAEGLKEASHRTLETLINNLPGLVYRCRNNRQWTMEYLSKGCTVLTGYPPEALIDSERLTYADLIVPEDREQVWQNVQVSLREHRPFELMYRIRTAEGQEKWVLERGRGNFSESGELLGVEGFITDVTREKSAQLRLRSDILLDPGTSLPTPTLFLDRLEMALRRRRAGFVDAFAVIVVHLDQFAKWRETLDSEVREFALLEVGRRLERLLTPIDSLSLWTESEFAILQACQEDGAEPVDLTEAIQQAIRAPVVAGNTEMFLTASIGVATRLTGHETAEEVLGAASTAAARARNAGIGRVEFADMTTSARSATRIPIKT